MGSPSTRSLPADGAHTHHANLGQDHRLRRPPSRVRAGTDAPGARQAVGTELEQRAGCGDAALEAEAGGVRGDLEDDPAAPGLTGPDLAVELREVGGGSRRAVGRADPHGRQARGPTHERREHDRRRSAATDSPPMLAPWAGFALFCAYVATTLGGAAVLVQSTRPLRTDRSVSTAIGVDTRDGGTDQDMEADMTTTPRALIWAMQVTLDRFSHGAKDESEWVDSWA